jgi:hypothetical protein
VCNTFCHSTGARIRAIVGKEQESSCGQALHEAVEESSGFRVNPVEVLEDQQQRLDLAFAEHQALHGIEGPLAALRWIEPLPPRVLDGHIEESQEGGQGRLE